MIPSASAHAAQRAAERYGVHATEADWRQAVIDITDTVLGIRPAALLLKRWPERENWLIRLGGVAVRVVWQRNPAFVVTVLPAVSRR